MDQKEFRIAKIIDETAFIINGGKEDGITNGDRFTILGKRGEHVFDPDDGSDLGTIDVIKGEIIASTVYPRMTLCKTQVQNIALNSLNAFGSLFKHVELNVDQTQITGGLITIDDPIKVGDLVLMSERDSED